jgi:hypothetical protein
MSLLVLFNQPSGIAFDAASNSGYQAASSSYSWSHTCTGSNRYLLVGISMLSLAQTVTGITYNGAALTYIGAQNSVTGAARTEMWGLVAPASGTNTIAVTLSGAIASAGNASSYTGVNQTVPTESWNAAQATNVGAADATVNVTTIADNDWTVDILATDDTAVTVGTGQTQTGNVTGAGGSGAMSYKGPKTPAGSTAMYWTNVGALATWTVGSIALRNVAATSGSVSFSSATTDGADVLAAQVSVVVAFSSATTDGADVLSANVSPVVEFSSATTDGADTMAANVSPVVAFSSATTDGADVLAGAVDVTVAFSSATTDGADVLAAVVDNSNSASFSTAVTDGADVLAASVSVVIGFTAPLTEGADTLAAAIDTGTVTAVGGYGDDKKKKQKKQVLKDIARLNEIIIKGDDEPETVEIVAPKKPIQPAAKKVDLSFIEAIIKQQIEDEDEEEALMLLMF